MSSANRIVGISRKRHKPRAAVQSYWDEFELTISLNPGLCAPNTLLAYGRQFEHFDRWCADQGQVSLPATDLTVCYFIQHLTQRAQDGQGVSRETIEQACKAIGFVHRQASAEDPMAHKHSRNARAQMRRTVPARTEKKMPIRLEATEGALQLDTLLSAQPSDLKGARDRALLSVGFDLGVRAEELVALNLPDLRWKKDYCLVLVRKSKADQEGRGRFHYISPRACYDLKDWFEKAGIDFIGDTGAVFRKVSRHNVVLQRSISRQTVSVVIKAAARLAGLPEHLVASVGTHSLRRGHSHELYAHGKDLGRIMHEMGWSQLTTAQSYLDDIMAEESSTAAVLRQKRSLE